MTNPNTQLLRRDLQLCMASGPDAPPPPTPQSITRTHTHTHLYARTDTHTHTESNPNQILKQSASLSFPI